MPLKPATIKALKSANLTAVQHPIARSREQFWVIRDAAANIVGFLRKLPSTRSCTLPWQALTPNWSGPHHLVGSFFEQDLAPTPAQVAAARSLIAAIAN